MISRLVLLTALSLFVAAPAKAERQTYNPYTMGVTQYQMEREMARQQRAAFYGTPVDNRQYRRGARRITLEEERQVIAIDKEMKQRFPIHPGMYRDAYDRGTFKRSTDGGNNPRD